MCHQHCVFLVANIENETLQHIRHLMHVTLAYGLSISCINWDLVGVLLAIETFTRQRGMQPTGNSFFLCGNGIWNVGD